MDKQEYDQRIMSSMYVKGFGTVLEYGGLLAGFDGVLRPNGWKVAGGLIIYLIGKGIFNHLTDAELHEMNNDIIQKELKGLQGKVVKNLPDEDVEAKTEH